METGAQASPSSPSRPEGDEAMPLTEAGTDATVPRGKTHTDSTPKPTQMLSREQALRLGITPEPGVEFICLYGGKASIDTLMENDKTQETPAEVWTPVY